MKFYIEALQAEIKYKPQQFFVGMCVFFVVVMGTTVQHVASIGFTLLVLYSFFVIKSWRSTWSVLTGNEKLLLGSLGLYSLSGILAFSNVQDTHEYIKELERYLRFSLAVPIYLLIKTYKLKIINYLYAGAVFSGPFLFYIAISAYIENPDVPSKGYYHHIIFGSLAMLNVGVMLSILLTVKINRLLKTIIFISLVLGFVAVILSQARGVWLALPLYVLLAMYFSFKHSLKRFIGLIIIITLLGATVFMSPVGDMVSKRVDVAVNEVSDFFTDEKYISSVGTRLAMWEIAVDVFKDHPFVGSGPGDFDNVIRELQQQGKYVGMDVHGSTHNIYFQSLANAGLFGFLTMLLVIIIIPLKIIIQQSRVVPTIKALVTFVFILLFVTVGMSESWTLRLPTVSVFIVFLVATVSNLYISDKR